MNYKDKGSYGSSAPCSEPIFENVPTGGVNAALPFENMPLGGVTTALTFENVPTGGVTAALTF